MLKFRLAAALAGIAALIIGASSLTSANSLSDREAAELVGGACPFKVVMVNCNQLTRTVVNEDGTTETVACPASPFNVRILTPDENGDTSQGALLNVTCNGCGSFYKRIACTTVDPDIT